MPPDVTRSI